MAKQIRKVPDAVVVDGIGQVNALPDPVTFYKKGDRFYIPSEPNLLMLGQEVDARDRNGNLVLNADGSVQKRMVAPRLVALRLDEANKPVDVVEIFVNTLAPMDANRSIVFPNQLTRSLRGKNVDQAFKSAACDNVFVITDEKLVSGRTWDRNGGPNKNGGWMVNAEGKFVLSDRRVFNFERNNPAPTLIDKEALKQYLYAAYEKDYSAYIKVEEAAQA